MDPRIKPVSKDYPLYLMLRKHTCFAEIEHNFYLGYDAIRLNTMLNIDTHTHVLKIKFYVELKFSMTEIVFSMLP